MKWLKRKSSATQEQWERYKVIQQNPNAWAFFVGRILQEMDADKIEKHLESTEMQYRK